MPLGNESFDGVTPPAIPASIDVVSGTFVTSNAQSFDGANSLAYAPTTDASEGEANLDSVVNPTDDATIATRYIYFGAIGSVSGQQFKVLLGDATGYGAGGYIGLQLYRDNFALNAARVALYSSGGNVVIHDDGGLTMFPSSVWLKVTVSKNALAVQIEVQRKDNDEYLAPAGTWQSSQIYVYDDTPATDVPDVVRVQTLFYNDHTGGTTPGDLHADGYIDDTLSSIVVEVTGTISGPVSSVSGSVAAGEVAAVTGTISGPVSTVTGAIDTLTAQEIDIYVASTGDDTTGDGSIGNPYETLEKVRTELRAIAPLLNDYIIHVVDKLPRAALGAFELDENDIVADGRSVTVYGGTVDELEENRGGLEGGIRVTGWTPIANGVYTAPYTSAINPRRIFVNQRDRFRVHRGSGFAGSPTRISTGYTVDLSDDIFADANVDTIEVRYDGNYNHSWNRIASVNGGTGDITMLASHTYLELIPENGSVGLLYKARFPIDIVNCKADFDAAVASGGGTGGKGLFYHDVVNDELLYKPYDWENLATADVVVPQIERLLHVTGQGNAWKFKGMFWDYTHYDIVQTEGFAERASNRLYWPVDHPLEAGLESDAYYIPAAVHIEGESGTPLNVDFSEGNRIRFFCGMGLHAFSNLTGQITGNRAIWGSGNGFVFGHTVVGTVDSTLLLDNNDAVNIGREFWGSIGIVRIGQDQSICEHYHVKNSPYIAIASFFDNVGGTTQYGKIENCMVHGVDGAAIYLHGDYGASTKHQVRHNHIINTTPGNTGVYHSLGSDITLYTAGFYTDNSAKNIEAETNVFEETGPSPALVFLFNMDNEVNGIRTNDNWSDNTTVLSGGAFPPDDYEAPILLAGQAGALAVMAGAGLEEPYLTAFAGEDIYADVLGTLSGPVSTVSGTTEANEEVLVEVTGTLSGPVSSVTGALTSETIEAEITGTVTAPISNVSGSVVATEILAELTGAISGPISVVSGTAYVAALVTLSGAIEAPVSGITGIVDITAGALSLRVGSVRVYDELFMGSLP